MAWTKSVREKEWRSHKRGTKGGGEHASKPEWHARGMPAVKHTHTHVRSRIKYKDSELAVTHTPSINQKRSKNAAIGPSVALLH